jgi:hypothetical protein
MLNSYLNCHTKGLLVPASKQRCLFCYLEVGLSVGLKSELAEYGGGPSDDPPVISGSNGDTHISSNGI